MILRAMRLKAHLRSRLLVILLMMQNFLKPTSSFKRKSEKNESFSEPSRRAMCSPYPGSTLFPMMLPARVGKVNPPSHRHPSASMAAHLCFAGSPVRRFRGPELVLQSSLERAGAFSCGQLTPHRSTVTPREDTKGQLTPHRSNAIPRESAQGQTTPHRPIHTPRASAQEQTTPHNLNEEYANEANPHDADSDDDSHGDASHESQTYSTTDDSSNAAHFLQDEPDDPNTISATESEVWMAQFEYPKIRVKDPAFWASYLMGYGSHWPQSQSQ